MTEKIEIKKEKNNHRQQTVHLFPSRAAPGERECSDASNYMTEGQVWPTRGAERVAQQHDRKAGLAYERC
jgi:hypothetical protein